MRPLARQPQGMGPWVQRHRLFSSLCCSRTNCTEPSTAKSIFQLQALVLIHRLSGVFSRG